MSEGTEHLSSCEKDGCELCDHYLEFCMACDHCGHWGQNDSDGWTLGLKGVYCRFTDCMSKAGDSPLEENHD